MKVIKKFKEKNYEKYSKKDFKFRAFWVHMCGNARHSNARCSSKKAVADFDIPLIICDNDLVGASFFQQTHPDSFYFGPNLHFLHGLHTAISDSSCDQTRYKSIVRLFLDYIKKRYEEELAYRLIIRFDAPVNLVNTISML